MQIPEYLDQNELTDKELQETDMVVKETIEANLDNCRAVAANVQAAGR